MMTYVDSPHSSNIARIGYDPETETARVEFKDKEGHVRSIYDYSRVPSSVMDEWMAAQSAGQFLHTRISSQYAASKVE